MSSPMPRWRRGPAERRPWLRHWPRPGRTPEEIDELEEILKEQIKAPERSIRAEDIQKVCADFFRLPLEAIKGKRRTNSIVFPRQVAMYVCRKLTDCSLAEIGAKFGHRDHTTVIYACDKIEQLIKSDRNVKETVDKIIALVSAQPKD